MLSTTARDLELAIPKLRSDSVFPSLLERHRRIDQAVFAVVMEAYLTGTSVRKVDDLVQALGADTEISKSEVARIYADLDTQVAVFAERAPSETALPYVFLHATYNKACIGGAKGGGDQGIGQTPMPGAPTEGLAKWYPAHPSGSKGSGTGGPW